MYLLSEVGTPRRSGAERGLVASLPFRPLDAGGDIAARCPYQQQPTIGKDLDDAMITIERDNPSLKNTLPKDYTRPHLDKQGPGGVIDRISTIGLGDAESRAKDILGRVYEYFLS